MTSKPQSISESHHEVKPVKSKNKLNGGANFEINEHYLDEILQNNNIRTYMCNYNFIFILLYKYDDNIIQNSLCSIIKLLIVLFIFQLV